MTFIVRPLVKTNPHLHFCNKNSRLHERRGECNKIVQKHTSNIEKGTNWASLPQRFFFCFLYGEHFLALSPTKSLYSIVCVHPDFMALWNVIICHFIALSQNFPIFKASRRRRKERRDLDHQKASAGQGKRTIGIYMAQYSLWSIAPIALVLFLPDFLKHHHRKSLEKNKRNFHLVGLGSKFVTFFWPSKWSQITSHLSSLSLPAFLPTSSWKEQGRGRKMSLIE